MAVEIEKKYRLSKTEFDVMPARLEEEGAGFIREDFEENIIFRSDSMPPGSVLRIRKTSNGARLTFKRRIASASDAKHQIEYETEISDPSNTEQIVRELGLVPRIIYEKRRNTWELGGAEVVLDELPFGYYLEIEGPEAAIADIETLLQIQNTSYEERTYPALAVLYGKSDGALVEARFSDERH